MNTKRMMLGVLVVVLGVASSVRAETTYQIVDHGMTIQEGWWFTSGHITVSPDPVGEMITTGITSWDWSVTNGTDTVEASGGPDDVEWFLNGIWATPASLYVISPMVVPGNEPPKTSSLTGPGSNTPALSMAAKRIWAEA